MTKKYKQNTLGHIVLEHKNSYQEVMKSKIVIEKHPTFSVVIPYYETLLTINYCLKSIIEATTMYDPSTYEILVVDDGSTRFTAKNSIESSYADKIKIIETKKNRGRYYSRNVGLISAMGDTVFFIDSDIVIPNDLLENHLAIHTRVGYAGKSCVTMSLFNFISLNEFTKAKTLDTLFKNSNDFRKSCVYRSSWIGSEEDKSFIGNNYSILVETDNLKKWPDSGYLGPWILPNMVLGGLFAVNRKQAISVGGCSNVFGKYGFEETSLVTKLMAKYCSFIIPDKAIALHLDDGCPLLTRREKDLLFQKTHDIYFSKYINLSIDQTIKNDKINFQKIKIKL